MIHRISRGERERDAEEKRECVKCVRMSVCYELSLAARGSGVVAGPVSGHCLHPGCHLRRPSQHVSSQVQTALAWVEIRPLRTPCRVLPWKRGWIFTQDVYRAKSVWFLLKLKKLYFTNVQNLQKAQAGKKVVDKVMKFPFCNSNIYWVTNFQMNLWVNFYPLRTAKVKMSKDFSYRLGDYHMGV